MARILLTPEYLRQVGGKFKTAANETQSEVAGLSKQMEDLCAQWEGATREKFYADFEKALATMRQYNPVLESIGDELIQISQRFAEADQQATGQQAPGQQAQAAAEQQTQAPADQQATTTAAPQQGDIPPVDEAS
jgi:WXG100 family type VII secretion target